MTISYKPEGHSDVSPYLIVSGAGATIDFLKTAFDGVELCRYPGENGKVHHAEVKIGDSVVMLADATEAYPAQPANVHIYVKDVDAVYAKAMQAGATSIQPPVRKEDPDKRGGVQDAGGTFWWIGTRQE
jgi:uncharacterized glyoxalase superfamily protein PhnB